jgi:drug/metabolite transporter (DMT)-like permease
MERYNVFQQRKISTWMMLVATMIWGMGFIAQSEGAKHVPPFFFNGVRFWIGAAVILPMSLIRTHKNTGEKTFWTKGEDKKILFQGSFIDGIILFVAMSLQQIGIGFSTPSKAGFLISLNIIFVPIIRMFFGEKIKVFQWVGIFAAMVGVSLLTLNEELEINPGDLFLIIATVFYALNTIVSGHYNKTVESFKYTMFRFIVGAVFCNVISFFTESVTREMVIGALPSILFAGVLSSGVAFSLQSFAQSYLDDLSIALILSMESVFAAIFAWAIVGDVLSTKELLGCIIIFISVVYIQIVQGKDVEPPQII